MIFDLFKASDWKFESEIEINSINDLTDFIDKIGKNGIKDGVIIYGNARKGDEFKHEYSITIYDDYVE